MAVFRNRFYTGRNYECTNVVACEAKEPPATSDNRWVPSAGNGLLLGLTHLYTEADVRYFGHL